VDNSGAAYQNIKVVAKSGGDYTTITAALNSIVEANPNNPYLIYVAPGVYNEQVVMKPYVDIEGSGELTTKITFIGNAGEVGTVLGANNAELRFLTVENTGGSAYALAIFSDSASPRLSHVTASASGGILYNLAVYNKNSASPMMKDVTTSASGGMYSYGVYNYSYSSPVMTNVTANASGGTYSNFGVNNSNHSSPAMTQVITNASGGIFSYGVYNVTNSSPAMTQVTAIASDLTGNNYGVCNDENSAPIINNSTLRGGGAGLFNYHCTGSCTVLVNNSQITGGQSIANFYNYITHVGASQLSGGAVNNAGTLICAGVYDENYTFYASTCP